MLHLHEYDWVLKEHNRWTRLCECGFDPDTPAWRVLITGSREYSDNGAVFDALIVEYGAALDRGLPMVVIHGAATGADTLAHEWAEWTSNVTPDPHPANWKVGKFAGNVRNQLMVDLGADVCLAFPLPGSIGTWDCIHRAEDAGIEVKVLEI